MQWMNLPIGMTVFRLLINSKRSSFSNGDTFSDQISGNDSSNDENLTASPNDNHESAPQEEEDSIHTLLCKDSVYCRMDSESQHVYCLRIAKIAKRFQLSATSVVQAIFALCSNARPGSVENHCGYYLFDNGYSKLLSHMNLLSWPFKTGLWIKNHLFFFWCILSWLCFFAFLAWGFIKGYALVMLIPFSLLFTIAFQQVIMPVIQKHIQPDFLPRIALDHLDDENRVLVVCPTIVTSMQKGIAALKRMAAYHLENPDPHIDFLLLADFPNALRFSSATDHEMVSAIASATVQFSNHFSYPFMFMHCNRSGEPRKFTRQEKQFIQKSNDLLLRMTTGNSVPVSFAYSSIDPELLCNRYRFLLTLDENTELTSGSVLKMVGTLLHPLQTYQSSSKFVHGVGVLIPDSVPQAHRANSIFSNLTNPACIQNRTVVDGFCYNSAMFDISAYRQAISNKIADSHSQFTLPQLCVLAGCSFDANVCFNRLSPQTLAAFITRRHHQLISICSALRLLIPWNSFRKMVKPSVRIVLWFSFFSHLMIHVQLLNMTYAVISNRTVLFLIASVLPVLTRTFPFSFRAFGCSVFRTLFLPAEAGLQPASLLSRLYQRFMKTTIDLHQTVKMIFILQFLWASLYAVAFIFFRRTWIGLFAAVLWAFFPVILPALERANKRKAGT